MEFHVLGPLEVTEYGKQLELGSPKQRALLAILLLRANRALPKHLLVDALWGAAPPASAEKNLYVYICNLRRVLGRDRIIRRDPGYLVSVRPGELDLDRFEDAVRAGGRTLAEGRPRDACEQFEKALANWSDAALVDLSNHPYLQSEAVRLEDRRVTTLELKMDASLALGRHGEVCDALSALVAEYPLRERLRAQHMLALFRAGRRADAFASYDHARRALASELGLEPGPLLARLYDAMLQGRESAEAPVAEVATAGAAARGANAEGDAHVARRREAGISAPGDHPGQDGRQSSALRCPRGSYGGCRRQGRRLAEPIS